MTETVRTAPEAEESLPESGERGRVEINRAVLIKIAEHAADLVPDCVRVRRRIAGVGMGEHGASARLYGPERELRIRLDLALRYPVSVPDTVRAVRESVSRDLGRIAECHIRTIDVTVSALVPASAPARVE